MQYDARGNLKPAKPGYLNTATYKAAKAKQKELSGTKVPFRPLDCWLVVHKIEEKTESGIILKLHEYDKEREVQCVVLAAGPGFRTQTGPLDALVETGTLIPNPVKTGEIVQVLERLLQEVKLNGETYWLVESHRCLFVIE